MNRRFSNVAVVVVLWLVVVLCGATWISAQQRLDARRDSWPTTYPLMYVPSGQYLQPASLGYRTVLADLLYLWSIQYYGHTRTLEGRRWLEHIYDVITDLDPQFIDAYLIGALIMSADMSDPEMALRLLDKGREQNPDEWILPLEAGFTAYMNAEQYDRAARYFEEARRKGGPDFAERLQAHMLEVRGDLQTAFELWYDVYQEAEAEGDERVAGIAYNHVYDLRVKLDFRAIDEALQRFAVERGRPAPSLQALARAGYLDPGLLVNPNDTPYEYDPETGELRDPDAGRQRGS